MTCVHQHNKSFCDVPGCPEWGLSESDSGYEVRFVLYTNGDPMSRMPGREINRSDLKVTFEGFLPDLDDSRLAERVFHLFNVDHRPNGKSAPSMSVGDVVLFERSGEKSAMLCEAAGFKILHRAKPFATRRAPRGFAEEDR